MVWGRQDKILDPSYAQQFMDALPDARDLAWVDACGHCSHLEQPQALADAVASFVAELRGGGSGGAAAERGELAGAASSPR